MLDTRDDSVYFIVSGRAMSLARRSTNPVLAHLQESPLDSSSCCEGHRDTGTARLVGRGRNSRRTQCHTRVGDHLML